MSVAVTTWTLAWDEVRNELCRKLGAKREWAESARLLRVLPCSGSYAWNVQDYFNQRRGSNLLFSPLDWLLVEVWGSAGIPEAAIKWGIDKCFDRRDRGRQFRACEVNSLSYCAGAVIRELETMKEASVGSAPRSNKGTGNTLLIALPPSGKTIFSALQSEPHVHAIATEFQVGLVFTVYPQEWHLHQARERFGEELKFLDPDPVHPETPQRSGRLAGTKRRLRPSRLVPPAFLGGGASA